MTEPLDYLIVRHGYYYRPHKRGYTREVRSAGRYTKSDAEREAAIDPHVMSAVPLNSLPPDPRIVAVCEHFEKWHGGAPAMDEISALLNRIDEADRLAGGL